MKIKSILITLLYSFFVVGCVSSTAENIKPQSKFDSDFCVKQLKGYTLLIKDQSEIYTNNKILELKEALNLTSQEAITIWNASQENEKPKALLNQIVNIHLATAFETDIEGVSSEAHCDKLMAMKKKYKELLLYRDDVTYDIAMKSQHNK